MTSGADTHRIAIIGAGYSGALTAIQLTTQADFRPASIVLIDQAAHWGRGAAYSATRREQLLNVPAANMSALPDEPDHFVDWVRRRGVQAAPGAYLPRALYGDYLAEMLEQTMRTPPVEPLRGSVTDIRLGRDAPEVVLDDGRVIRAEHVVLATGNFPPADPPIRGLSELDPSNYVRNPWKFGALDNTSPRAAVLLIGTGLTMVDVAVELQARGHLGPIHAASRRGLLPQRHLPAGQKHNLSVPPEVLQAKRTAVGLLRGVRAAMRRERGLGRDWRDVVAALRSMTARLWQSLPTRERARFLRHVRPYWDPHRHRCAPETAAAIDSLRQSRQLTVHAARVVGFERSGPLIRATLRHRTGAETRIDVARVVNCTGPESDVRRLDQPLWRNLLERGLIQPDELGLGILSDPDGAVIDRDGRPAHWLSVIGPLRKAQLWECIAVPELREHARALAKRLVERAGIVRPEPKQQLRRTGRDGRAAAVAEGGSHD